VIAADLSRRGAAESLAASALQALGGVDVLINNAGCGVGGRMSALGDGDDARKAFETNFWSPLALIKALVPAMVEAGRGNIVNVTSLAQITTWPSFGGYAATKAALAAATETLAMEVHGSGVHVLEVIPGPVDTPLHAETLLTPGIDRMFGRLPLGDSAELARRVVQALERGESRLIYPGRARFPYLFPRLVRRDLRRLAARSTAIASEAPERAHPPSAV
jgi:short-subunit dehydrogenase